jgi:hypothetical protein
MTWFHFKYIYMCVCVCYKIRSPQVLHSKILQNSQESIKAWSLGHKSIYVLNPLVTLYRPGTILVVHGFCL